MTLRVCTLHCVVMVETSKQPFCVLQPGSFSSGSPSLSVGELSSITASLPKLSGEDWSKALQASTILAAAAPVSGPLTVGMIMQDFYRHCESVGEFVLEWSCL